MTRQRDRQQSEQEEWKKAKFEEMQKQAREEKLMMLHLFNRIAKSFERIATCMERSQAPNSPILGPNGTVVKDEIGSGHA